MIIKKYLYIAPFIYDIIIVITVLKSIEEMLGDSNLKSQLVNVKAADEMRALEGFYTALSNDPDRACYGYPSVLTVNNLAFKLLLHSLTYQNIYIYIYIYV